MAQYWYARRPKSAEHQHPFLVFDVQDRLHSPLTTFAKEACARLSPKTVPTYLYALMPYFTWLDADPWQVRAGQIWDARPQQVRRSVDDYLVQKLRCQILPQQQGWKYVAITAGTHSSLRIFLAALKLFYQLMRERGMYTFANPLVDPMSATINAALDHLEREEDEQHHPRMPARSGVESTPKESVCTGSACTGVQVSPEQAHALATYGISLTSYAWYSVVVTILSTLIWFSAGWLIFWHTSDSWVALLLALQAVTQGAATSIAALGSFPVLQYPATGLLTLNQVLIFMVIALFPTGHFVPKWLRWLVLMWVAYNLVDLIFHGTLQLVGWYSMFSFLFFLGLLVILAIAQIYRYRSVSTPAQRQQTKWVVFPTGCATR